MKFAAVLPIALIASEASATCLEGIKMEMFTDTKCKTPKKGQEVHTMTKKEADGWNLKCQPANPYQVSHWKKQKFNAVTMHVICDTVGITADVYN